ncbi:MAG: hypothetical protein AAF960_02000 [Bacteroidota bacterium]
MEPTEVHFQIQAFIELVKNSADSGVEIDKRQTNMFDRFLTEPDFQKKFGQLTRKEIDKLKVSKNVTISQDQEIAFSLFWPRVTWSRADKQFSQPALTGGFVFSDGVAMLTERTDGWKKNQDNFLEYEKETTNDQALLDQLLWFESPTAPISVELYAPYYGCVLPNDHSFPHDFYFYDDGLMYQLPFNGYQEYIEALLANAAVQCWQYFYVPPQELVRKNKGLNYMTTFLRINTQLAEDFHIFEYNPTYTFDRLDIIHEYLQRVVRFLPLAFPTLNFDHQKAYLKELNQLM